MNKFFYIFLITLLFTNCNFQEKGNTPYEIFSYYDSGNIKEHMYFSDVKDTLEVKNFKMTTYWENGSKKLQFTAKDGKPDGPYIRFYPNGQINQFYMYKDGALNGVFRSYTESGLLEVQILNVQHTPVVFERWKYYKNVNVCHCYYWNDSTGLIGGKISEKNGMILKEMSHYFEVNAPDSISLGEEYRADFYFFHTSMPLYVQHAAFGDFDTTFLVTDSSKFVFLSSPDHHLSYNFYPEEKGDQLILGVAHVINKEDSTLLKRDFIVYKEFFVKDN